MQLAQVFLSPVIVEAVAMFSVSTFEPVAGWSPSVEAVAGLAPPTVGAVAANLSPPTLEAVAILLLCTGLVSPTVETEAILVLQIFPAPPTVEAVAIV